MSSAACASAMLAMSPWQQLLTSKYVPAQALEKYHPLGLTENWSDKLASTDFYSPNQLATFEHHMQASACSYFHLHAAVLR